MYPHEPVMTSRESYEWTDTMLFGRVIIRREALKKLIECFSLWRYVSANRYGTITKDACFHPLLFLVLNLYPAKTFGQAAVEPFVYPTQ
jgi:hypothetical protein